MFEENNKKSVNGNKDLNNLLSQGENTMTNKGENTMANNNSIQLFQNESFGKVRVIIRNGEPWFVANDVAAALG